MRPPDAWREYLIASTFGYTPVEIDSQPAVRLDWLLACHGVVEQFKADKQKEASRG